MRVDELPAEWRGRVRDAKSRAASFGVAPVNIGADMLSLADELEAALAQQAGALEVSGEFADWFQAWATGKGLTMVQTADGRYLCPDTALAEAAYSSACMTAAIWYMELCRQEALASSAPGGGGEGP